MALVTPCPTDCTSSLPSPRSFLSVRVGAQTQQPVPHSKGTANAAQSLRSFRDKDTQKA